MDELANAIKDKGLNWIRCREIANIVHVISTMSLQSKNAKIIMEFVSQKETARRGEHMLEHVAKQGPSSTYSLFLLEAEKRSSWLINEGNPQEVANTALACATMGLQSPKLFAKFEKQSSWLVREGRP
jgi:hypothetical protein